MEGMEAYYFEDHNIERTKSLPPGFRFHPTDEELITYYLARKMADGKFRDEAITEVDLNKHEPWDLPGKAQMVGEKEWYFYTLKDRKYPSGSRTNRATKSGYWKATGKDKEVFMKATSATVIGRCSKRRQLVGMKKTLVFYEGRAPKGSKSNWVMHEYRMDEYANIASMLGNGFTKLKGTKEPWVLCRVFHKKLRSKKDRYSQEDADAEMVAAAAHFLLADADELRPLRPGGVAASYTNKLAKLPPDVAAPLLNLAGADICATTTEASTACSTSQLGCYNDSYVAAASTSARDSTRATEMECELALPYLLQEQYSSKHVEDYSRIYTAGCSTASSSGQIYCNGVSSRGDFSNYSSSSNNMRDCASSDAWLPANSASFASRPLPRFPSELESLWLQAHAFFV